MEKDYTVKIDLKDLDIKPKPDKEIVIESDTIDSSTKKDRLSSLDYLYQDEVK